MSREAWIIVILGIYLVAMLAVGWWANRRAVPTAQDYFLMGRSVGMFLLFATTFASLYSMGTVVGTPAFNYTHGIAGWIFSSHEILTGLLILVFGIPMYRIGRKFGYITPSDFLADRFESPFLGALSALILLVFVIPFSAMQIVGGAHILEAITKGAISYNFGVLAFAVVVVVYVAMGGMRAVVITDMIQFVLMVAAVAAMALVVLPMAGGMKGLFDRLHSEAPALLSLPGGTGLFKPITWMSWWLALQIGQITAPITWTRFYAARDEKILYWLAILMPVGIFLINVAILLFGLSGRVLVPGLKVPDELTATLLSSYLAPAFTAFLLAGAFAAGMSTVSSFILSGVANVTRDIYQRIINPKVDEAKLIKASAWISVAIGIIAIMAAFKPPKLMVLIVPYAFQGFATVGVVGMLGAWWGRANKAGAMAGLIGGFLTQIITRQFIVNPLQIDTGTWSVVATAVLMIVVSLATPRQSDEHLSRFSEIFQWGKSAGKPKAKAVGA